MDNIIQQGYLHYHARGIGNEFLWKKRYYIVRGKDEKHEPRLDWYETAEDFHENPHVFRSMYIQQIEDVTQYESTERKFTFEIIPKEHDGQHLYAADDATECRRWLASLASAMSECQPSSKAATCRPDVSQLDDHRFLEQSHNAVKYPVLQIIDTEASRRCMLFGGGFTIYLHTLNLALANPKGKIKYIWPYRYIRRYGRSKNTFTFEAGRKCPSGEGLFTFKVEDGNQLFESVEERTKAMKRDVAASPPSPTSTPPSHPPAVDAGGDAYVNFAQRSLTTNAGNLFSATLPSSLTTRDLAHQQPDSGFGTMDSSSSEQVLLPLPPMRPIGGGGHNQTAAPVYAKPHKNKQVAAGGGSSNNSSTRAKNDSSSVSSSDDERDDVYEDPERISSMPELLAAMNRTRLDSGNGRSPVDNDYDSYEHIDLKKATEKRRSSKDHASVSSDNVYGELSLSLGAGSAKKHADVEPGYEDASSGSVAVACKVEDEDEYCEINSFH